MPTEDVKLLPSVVANPFGRRPIGAGTVGERHRWWVTGLPDFVVAAAVQVDGRPATNQLAFDKAKISLLRNRERLLAAVDADDWAKAEAMPSNEEIRRLRRLIDRVRQDVDDLTAEDRAQIEQAVAVVRRGRAIALGVPRVRPLIHLREEHAQ